MIDYLEAVTEYADRVGYRLNPVKHYRDKVIAGLTRNREKHGFPYCPCKVRTGNLLQDKAIICPCDSHKQEIEDNGHCTCNLFYKVQE